MSNPEAKGRDREREKRINEEIFHIYCDFAHVCYVCLLVRALFIMYELCIGCLCKECSRSSVPPSISFCKQQTRQTVRQNCDARIRR